MESPLFQTFSPAATRMLRMDHARVLALFHQLRADAPPSVQSAICRNICTALEIHTRLEEELFYPALRELDVQLPALDRSLADHDNMHTQMAHVRALADDPRGQQAALHALITDVLHHVADEETQVLPAAEQLLGTQRLKELGALMTRRRFELARPRAAEMAVDTVRAEPVKTALVAAGTLLAGSLLYGQLRRRRNARH